MSDAPLRHAYARVRATQPGVFCASRLGDPEDAARVLGCPVETVIVVGLCLAPTRDEDVVQIATARGVDVDRLRLFFAPGEA